MLWELVTEEKFACEVEASPVVQGIYSFRKNTLLETIIKNFSKRRGQKDVKKK